jgi:transcriptional regulator of acetoin/glycerol metabolism
MRSSWRCVRPAATVCRPQQPSGIARSSLYRKLKTFGIDID